MIKNRDDVRRVRAGDLTFASEYNRDIDKNWVRKIVVELVEVPPVIEVSDRGNGVLVIVDGQHRVTAVLEKWGPNSTVIARVHRDLSVPQEAALFYRLNQRRNLRAFNAFHSLYVSGDVEATDIVKVLANYGLSYGQAPTTNQIAAVGALRSVYGKYGMAALDQVLGLLVSAWGHDQHTWDANLIHGFGLFIDHYEGADLKRLVGKLSTYKGGAVGFLRDAKGIAQPLRKSNPRAVVWMMVETYNKGSRVNQLPPWQ